MKIALPIFCFSLNIILSKGLNVARIGSIEDILCHDSSPGSKLPHPEFCNVFLVCSDNVAMQIACESGVYFNPDIEQCDPDYKICKSGSKTTTTDDPETDDPDSTSDDYVDETTTEEVQPTTSDPSIIVCPQVDSQQVIFLSHASDCTIYYLCYHGKPIPFQCSAGLHWNQKKKRCAPKEIAQCRAANSHKPSITSECPNIGIEFLPHPDNCHNFIFCQNGARSVQQCQPFYHWDINERKCKLKSLATCYRDLKE